MKKIKNVNQGFTLLELLVVVLIIGILVAIALPQYKLAVAKSEFNTLKNVTKSLKESVDRYFLAKGAYPKKFADLDINLGITSEWDSGSSFYIIFPNVTNCEIYYKTNNLYCKKYIASKLMMYNHESYPSKIRQCIAYSANGSDIPNKICQSETNKTWQQSYCSSGICSYRY